MCHVVTKITTVVFILVKACFAYHIGINKTLPYGSKIFDVSLGEFGAIYAVDSMQTEKQARKLPFEIDKINGNVIFVPDSKLQDFYFINIFVEVPRYALTVVIPLSVWLTHGSFSDITQRKLVLQSYEVQIENASWALENFVNNVENVFVCPSVILPSALCSCDTSELIGTSNPSSWKYFQKIARCNLKNTLVFEQYSLVEVKAINKAVSRKKRSAPIHFQQQFETVGVRENLPANSLVKTMQVLDSRNRPQSNVRYSLEARQNRQSLNMFAINIATGALTTLRPLDREQMPSHYLIVVALRDEAVARCYLQVNVIDQNDETPHFEEKIYNFDVPENQPEGTPIARIRATDKDSGANGRIAYSISESVPPTSSFNIRPDGMLVVNGVVDREIASKYTLTIVAKDGGSPSRSSSATVKAVIIDKNDNFPQFSKASYNVLVKEDVPVGTDIKTVVATDKDEGRNGEVRYALLNGGNDKRTFAIDSKSGVISVLSKLDYEASQKFTLRIRASDLGTPSLSNSSGIVRINVVDVNDNTPHFLSPAYHEFVKENARVGSEVGRVQAFDADYGSASGISYSIVSVTDRSFPFQIESREGILRVAKELDYERKTFYKFIVRASDSGHPRHTVDTNVTVTVQDVNDNAPVFTPSRYDIKCPEDTRIGTQLVRVTATDPDESPSTSALLSYQIIEGNQGSKFSIASYGGAGVITLSGPLNYEHQKDYKLKVRVSDGALSNSTYVNIHVTDTNSYQPTFDKSTYEVPLSEGVRVGSIVVTVHASDKDSGDNARITYCFTEPVR